MTVLTTGTCIYKPPIYLFLKLSFSALTQTMEEPKPATNVFSICPMRGRYSTSSADGVEREARFSVVSDEENVSYSARSVASHGSDVMSGYDTLDAPPRYEFYSNTEVAGRRRFRPSLFELHSNQEVRLC